LEGGPFVLPGVPYEFPVDEPEIAEEEGILKGEMCEYYLYILVLCYTGTRRSVAIKVLVCDR